MKRIEETKNVYDAAIRAIAQNLNELEQKTIISNTFAETLPRSKNSSTPYH